MQRNKYISPETVPEETHASELLDQGFKVTLKFVQRAKGKHRQRIKGHYGDDI